MASLNPQAAAWLQASADAGVPPLDQMPVPDARATLGAVAAQCGGEVQEVASVVDDAVPGPAGDIPVRIYTPQGSGLFPVLVYYHGGGWVLGDRDSAEHICRRLANRAHCVVVSVDYRLAPEAPFPAAVEDAVAALKWVVEKAPDLNVDSERIAVGGDSAGGNLAAVVALDARDNDGPQILQQLLFYPATDFTRETASYAQNGEGYFLTAPLIEWFGQHYAADPDDWRASPLKAASHANLPAAYIVTAEFDPLRDEGQAYADALTAAGSKAQVDLAEGHIHGFVTLLGAIPDAVDVVDRAGLALRDSFRQGWRPQIWLQEA
ncbi:alpha/beta hydrolase [Dermacoccaceae bacterium W4C1]